MCHACGNAANYVCSACSTPAYYCGPCRILENWDHHSMQCDGAAIINTHRAMQYSLTVNDEMTFVDVPIIPRDIGKGEFGYSWVALLCHYLDDPAARTIVSFGHDLEPLPSPIAIYFSVNEYLKGCLLNAPIAALADKSLQPPRPWYGPIVILKVLDDPVTNFGNIEVGDLEHVRAFFSYVQ
ncbi:hypothetical protein C8T65DRAFT_700209 [Cerioporus squamosus]|nr:hypothetical protein C8T65DRAFT_700209 [Cerioporus squamosus]